MSRLPSVLNLRARAASSLFVLGLLLLPLGGVSRLLAAPESEGEVAAREVALELAGAFSNDGYKIRDGHWSGTLQPKAAQVITVNLYAGNQYYFSLGSTDKAKKVAVSVFDETGKPVAGEEFFQEPEKFRAAAGVSPVASGPYYVSVQLLDGAAAEFCLIYSYK
jgi:hypothetical protein